MQFELIETDRLKGKKICDKHWELWLNMGSNSEVMATLGGTWNQEKARDKMKWNCEQWETYRHGLWMLFDKENEVFVGRAGIRQIILNDNKEVELAYALMPDFWGRGLAVEIGENLLSIAFDKFCYSSIVACTLMTNKRSEKVMQKIGFTFEKNIIHAKVPHVLYRYQNPNHHSIL
ncbi:MAG: GNAT family N-acetyltransferase [Mastigocoleus sp.]